jgi:uncharacterized protein YbjQ (UPF0145 family)
MASSWKSDIDSMEEGVARGCTVVNRLMITPMALTLNDTMVTTANDLPGHRIIRNVGLVRGLVVRSRSVVGNIGAAFQTLVGGNITIYTELCERARVDAYGLMIEHAGQMGANAIIGMRYDANEVAAGVTEVLAYGTAVVTERL